MTRIQTDQYGFPLYIPTAEAAKFRMKEIENEAILQGKWDAYISKIGSLDRINVEDKQFKKLVRGGIYNQYRKAVWAKMTGVDQIVAKSQGMYDSFQQLAESIPPNVREAIDLDVPRTFSDSPNFDRGKLTRVLNAFALAHAEIGYVQSLNFLAAVFIAVMDEEQALWLLNEFVERYVPHKYFSGSMVNFQTDMLLIERLITEREPDIARHTSQLGHEWVTCSSGWILTCFANSFPIPTVLRIFDSLFLEGQKIIFRVAIAFVRMHHDLFLSATSIRTLTDTIDKAQREMFDANRLMDTAFNIKAFSRNHLIDLRESAKAEVKHRKSKSQDTVGRALNSLFGHLHL